MQIGTVSFPIGQRTFLMGILNMTPDSFSDGGSYQTISNALHHVEQMIAEGADIIDVGGESSRPGFLPVSPEEEQARVLPIISAIKKQYPNVPISIDTSKATVLDKAAQAGADMANDIWGFRKDPQMAQVVAKHNMTCCLMHNRELPHYQNLLEDIVSDLSVSIGIALATGIPKDRIILDPGIGFAKNQQDNLKVIQNIKELKRHLPYPFLLGASRKSFIGATLGGLPVQQRLEGTLAVSVIGVANGCDFIRVHDVLQNKRACQMTDALVREERRINGQHLH